MAKAWIAVQPFVNLSGIPSRQYSSDGIFGDIIDLLSPFSELRVATRKVAGGAQSDTGGTKEAAQMPGNSIR